MRMWLLGFALCAVSPAWAGTEVGECAFDGPALVCEAGDDPVEALRRFASPETAILLRTKAKQFPEIASRQARETYRRSVERQNARAARVARRADRALRRRRIADDDYAELVSLNRAALANYRLAISLYQRSYWFDDDEPEDLGPDEPDEAGDVTEPAS